MELRQFFCASGNKKTPILNLNYSGVPSLGINIYNCRFGRPSEPTIRMLQLNKNLSWTICGLAIFSPYWNQMDLCTGKVRGM